MFSNDNDIFGYSQYIKLKIGDFVSWTELPNDKIIVSPDKIKKFGIISYLYVAHRGDRRVAIARVVPFNDTVREKDILVISLQIVHKIKESLIL